MNCTQRHRYAHRFPDYRARYGREDMLAAMFAKDGAGYGFRRLQ
jgi:hypothetical protein